MDNTIGLPQASRLIHVYNYKQWTVKNASKTYIITGFNDYEQDHYTSTKVVKQIHMM